MARSSVPPPIAQFGPSQPDPVATIDNGIGIASTCYVVYSQMIRDDLVTAMQAVKQGAIRDQAAIDKWMADELAKVQATYAKCAECIQDATSRIVWDGVQLAQQLTPRVPPPPPADDGPCGLQTDFKWYPAGTGPGMVGNQAYNLYGAYFDSRPIGPCSMVTHAQQFAPPANYVWVKTCLSSGWELYCCNPFRLGKCPDTTGTRWDCVNNVCVQSPTGQYATLAECQAQCVATTADHQFWCVAVPGAQGGSLRFQCIRMLKSDPAPSGTVSGPYATDTACQAACDGGGQPTTCDLYYCVPSCLKVSSNDPVPAIKISGPYRTEAECKQACTVPVCPVDCPPNGKLAGCTFTVNSDASWSFQAPCEQLPELLPLVPPMRQILAKQYPPAEVFEDTPGEMAGTNFIKKDIWD